MTYLNDTYSRTPGVASIYVYADSHHDAPAAVVVPTKEKLAEWAARGITDPVENKIVIDELKEALLKYHAEAHLRGFERIQKIVVDTEPFSTDNGLLTPSMKPQWKSLRKKYEARIIEVYDKD